MVVNNAAKAVGTAVTETSTSQFGGWGDSFSLTGLSHCLFRPAVIMAKAQVMDSIHITLGFILKGFIAREIYFVLLCIFLLLCVIMYFVCIIMYFLVIMRYYVYTGKLVPYLFFCKD